MEVRQDFKENMMSMGRSIKKIYPTGDKIKVWTNNSGLSAGMLNKEESLAVPFLSFYTRNSGGYILKISKEELEKNKILLEIE